MSWREWLNPSTRWRGMSSREMRRNGTIWAMWFLVNTAYLYVLGLLMFKTAFFPDDSALVWVTFWAAVVLAIVSFFWAVARFAVAILLQQPTCRPTQADTKPT